VLIVLDAPAKELSADRELLATLRDRKVITVRNKIDLLNDSERQTLAEDSPSSVLVSARTGEGIDRLRKAVLELAGGSSAEEQSGMLTNLRQHHAVSAALAGLDGAAGSLTRRIPHEMVMLDLYAALNGIDALTGQTTTDDILNLIFSTFCIGK
jgi:tRNA modification GTPase